MFVLMPEAGLREEAREGKEGRKEREHRYAKSRRVTQPLSVPSESEVFIHSGHYVKRLYFYAKDMTKSTNVSGWHGNTSTEQKTSKMELSSIFCCGLVSNILILMIIYLLFPVTGHIVHCCSTAFPDVCKEN